MTGCANARAASLSVPGPRDRQAARELAGMLGDPQAVATAAGSFGMAGMMLGTPSFLVTTAEAWQEGRGLPQLSMLGKALLKYAVLLGAALLTAAESWGAG